MSEHIDRLRAICAAATKGPWRKLLSKDVVGPQGDNFGSPVVGYGATAGNAEHIATFDPQLVAAMLDVIEAAGDFHEANMHFVQSHPRYVQAEDWLASTLARFSEVAS